MSNPNVKPHDPSLERDFEAALKNLLLRIPTDGTSPEQQLALANAAAALLNSSLGQAYVEKVSSYTRREKISI